MKPLFILTLLGILTAVLVLPPGPSFGERIDRGVVQSEALKEASGLAASRRNPGILWTHNDSGDESRVFAIDENGRKKGIFTLSGITARDWEDIAVGPGPEAGRSYLYLADIGDNLAVFDLKYIHRIPEPVVDTLQAPRNTTLDGAETLTFRYPDGRFDAETLMVDPATGDLYVITKRDTTVTVYHAPFPQPTDRIFDLQPLTTLTFSLVPGLNGGGQGAVAGDIAPSGLEVLVKTYDKVYYWSRPDLSAPLFATTSVQVPYVREPQGEAVAWAADGGGYYTISEAWHSLPVHLYFYPRLPDERDR